MLHVAGHPFLTKAHSCKALKVSKLGLIMLIIEMKTKKKDRNPNIFEDKKS